MASKAKQFRRKVEGNIGAALLRGVVRMMRAKSDAEAERLGAKFGRWIHHMVKRRRETCRNNLRMAFPDWPEDKIQKVALQVFEHYGRVTADFVRAPDRSLETLASSGTILGIEHINEALKLGKGAILITAHFGNWERFAAYAALKGYPVNVVARATNNPKMNEMMTELRSAQGTRVIDRGDAARPILERLRKNEIIAILPDQNTNPDIDGIFLPFFGKPAGTVLGPGVIAERTGAPVLVCYCIWEGPCRYRMVIEPELKAKPGYEKRGEGMMRAINDALEQVIRQHPEQWLWFHDRWKSARQKGLL